MTEPSASAITRQVEKHDDDHSRVAGQCAVGQHPTARKPQMGRSDPMTDKTERNFHAIEGPNGMCACGVKADGTMVTCAALLEEYVQERILAAVNSDDDGSYLWERCYSCGHRLAFASDGCPQCGIHFKDGEDPANWPEDCDCERCVEARRTEPQ